MTHRTTTRVLASTVGRTKFTWTLTTDTDTSPETIHCVRLKETVKPTYNSRITATESLHGATGENRRWSQYTP